MAVLLEVTREGFLGRLPRQSADEDPSGVDAVDGIPVAVPLLLVSVVPVVCHRCGERIKRRRECDVHVAGQRKKTSPTSKSSIVNSTTTSYPSPPLSSKVGGVSKSSSSTYSTITSKQKKCVVI